MTGQCRLIGGKLVNLSIDVYISMEYAEGGDLFHLKGQVSGSQPAPSLRHCRVLKDHTCVANCWA